MSRHHWRCRNPACLAEAGATLGTLTRDGGGLCLAPSVRQFAIYLDSQRAEIVCPVCSTVRTFRGTAVLRNDEVTIR
jgi:hypothetical protein